MIREVVVRAPAIEALHQLDVVLASAGNDCVVLRLELQRLLEDGPAPVANTWMIVNNFKRDGDGMRFHAWCLSC